MPPTDPMAYAPCQVPLRRAMNVFGGINITVHAGCYEDVLEADRRWKANGGNALWDVRQNDTGSYNCRPSVAHSRAVAIDFNWSSNGMTSKRTPCPGDMPAAFYELCWKPLGYGWGALWNSKCDRMHISKLKSEGGDGVLYRTWDGEEDDVNKEELEAALKPIKTLLGVGTDNASGKTVVNLLLENVDGVAVDGLKLVRKEMREMEARLTALIQAGP